jgi:RHS repeat-associated protein
LFSKARYSPFGALTIATLGNGVTESWNYNKRLWQQSGTATFGSATPYSFSVATFAPNGDILAANDSVNGNWVYKFDAFNRLVCSNLASNGTCATPTSGTPTYTYDHDRFGNRWHQNGPQSSQLGFDANNRITGVTGVGYDLGGNLTSDGSGPGAHRYFYDAENRILQVDGTLGICSTATACYVYNAEGQRVRKTTGSSSMDHLYDLAGHKVAEVDPTGVFMSGELYAGGRHFAIFAPSPGPTGATFFTHSDWLGTERVRTDMTGTKCESIASLPYGDGQAITGPCGDVSPMHFTGKERDSESGLDNFEARYNSSSLGRFMSPDPDNTGASDDNPQSWNAYSYVLNNPINRIDPDGLDCIYVQSDGSWRIKRGDCASDTDNGVFVNGRISGKSVSVTMDASGNATGLSFLYQPTGSDSVLLHVEGDPAISPAPSFSTRFGRDIADAVKGMDPFHDPSGTFAIPRGPPTPSNWI